MPAPLARRLARVAGSSLVGAAPGLVRISALGSDCGASPRGIGELTCSEGVHDLTQEDLAEMVGTTPSPVGLFLKRFRDAGFVDVGRRSLLVDMRRLADYAHDYQEVAGSAHN